mgnify:FL=1
MLLSKPSLSKKVDYILLFSTSDGLDRILKKGPTKPIPTTSRNDANKNAATSLAIESLVVDMT